MLWKIISLSGILCLFYYALMCAAVRKWDSTFSRFWLLSGTGLLILGKLRIRAVIPILLVLSCIFLAVEARILLAMLPRCKEGLPYLVVLGAQVRGKSLSSSLYRRIRRAGQYLLENPDTVVIVSGGQGKGEDITEAYAMKQYLAGQGILEERIFQEERSVTTEENLRFSSAYIHDLSLPVGIVTSNYHMYRACCYAKRIGYQRPEAVPAGCPPVFFVNYMVREFFALMKMLVLGIRKKIRKKSQ